MLRSGLWGGAPEIPEGFGDWGKVARLAKSQSVLGVVGDVMLSDKRIAAQLSAEMKTKIKTRTKTKKMMTRTKRKTKRRMMTSKSAKQRVASTRTSLLA